MYAENLIYFEFFIFLNDECYVQIKTLNKWKLKLWANISPTIVHKWKHKTLV